MSISRRQFLGSAAAAAGAAACVPANLASGQSAAAARPMPEPIERLAEPFPLAQVRLGEGPFLDAARVNDDYLQSLAPERLAHMFRLTAGLPSSAEPLGGWEAPQTELRGHFSGHLLSACGMRHAMLGSEAARQQGEALLADLAACQKAHGNGYVSAFPESFFDRLANGGQVWAPFYTLHKIMAGCLDMATLCGNGQALEVAAGLGDWTGHWVKGMGDDQLQRVLRTEFGGLAESLWNLAALTGERKYAGTARRFEKTVFLDPLAAHRDTLKGLHVNTHIPQVIAAARRHELTGDPRYREIAHYFWHEVVGERSYAPGGTSNGEGWDTDPGELGGALSRYSQECCCGYNMLKLTRHLYTWSADPRYFDYYERTLWNSRLGTQHPGDGGKMYYLPLQTGWWKYFSSRLNSFWCCDGTGAEEFSKLADSIYFHGKDALYVNLFLPSELRWPERGLRLAQQTRFPAEATTRLRLEMTQPARLAVNLRVPAWTAAGGNVRVNGRELEAFANPGSYLTIERTWQTGDTIELTLPMGLRAEALKGDTGQQAVLYGPLVLAARLGSEGLTRAAQYDRDQSPAGAVNGGTEVAPQGGPQGTAEATLPPGQEVAAAPWVKQDAEALAFTAEGTTGAIEMAPLHQILGERYGVYWRVRRGGRG